MGAKKILINYADAKFVEAQKYCSKMAYAKGDFDEVWEYGPNDVEPWMIGCDCTDEHAKKRYGKYGLWRPYIICDALSKLEEGDYLCYLDSGAYFHKSVDVLIEQLEKDGQSIMCFEIPLAEEQWTKRDVFIELDADNERIANSGQIWSGMIIIKKDDYSYSFFKKYESISRSCPHLFTDEINKNALDNYESFIENRHNQSVFSVLAKKEHIIPFRDPTEFGDFPEYYKINKEYEFLILDNRRGDYSKVVIQHRYPQISLWRKVKLRVREILPARVYFTLSFLKRDLFCKIK